MTQSVVPYNGTGMTGGDSSLVDFNIWYKPGDISWMIASTALVLLMIPGVGLFYSGLVRRKSALSLLMLSLAATAVTTFQWLLWGYSLTFSHTAGLFYGDLQNVGFRNVLGAPSVGSPNIPDLLFAVYQGMFAAITVALAVGSAAERGRFVPCIIFMFVWSTLIYDPIACWTWNPSGWVNRLGGLDFAGGTPVHISSGTAALAYSIMLGPRRGLDEKPNEFHSHSTFSVVLGTIFLWIGWFGFNAGSANAANLRAVMAAVVTHVAACVGGITWSLIDYYYEHKFSCVGFCSGVITGLVAITPGSGYVPAWSAIVFGVVGSFAANYGTKIKHALHIDDALDIFAVHALGGLVGNILTGVFATDAIAHLDGVTHIRGGWIQGNWKQVPIQLCDSLAGGLYSFLGSLLILSAINALPGLRLRCTDIVEVVGIDDAEIGEFTYDYIGITRNLGDKCDAREQIAMYEEAQAVAAAAAGDGIELAERVKSPDSAAPRGRDPTPREETADVRGDGASNRSSVSSYRRRASSTCSGGRNHSPTPGGTIVLPLDHSGFFDRPISDDESSRFKPE